MNIEECHKYIRYEASKYPKYLREDLIQEGYLGLMMAIQKFNADYKVKLITYAIYYIKDYIRQYYKKNQRIIFVPFDEELFGEECKVIQSIYNCDMKNKLPKALEILNPREFDIIKSRYLKEEPTILLDLSDKYQISKERVRQIEVNALLKLRNRLDN